MAVDLVEHADAPDREKRVRALRRNKRLAAGALLIAAIAFVAGLLLRREGGWWAGLLGAAGEAGMVGGLADWFAVTALFRRPLGLPIPHTALIPTRKDEIGRSMARFIEEHFLDPATILERLRERNRAAQIGEWLAVPETANALSASLLDALPHLIGTIDDARVRHFLNETVRDRMGRLDLLPAATQLAATLLEEGRHLALLDALVGQVRNLLGEYRETLIATIGKTTGRFMPGFIDRQLASLLVQGLEAWLAGVLEPGSDTRERFNVLVRSKIEAFLASPEMPRLLGEATSRLAGNPAFQETVSALWDELKHGMLADAGRSPSKIGGTVAALTTQLGTSLAQTGGMQTVVNNAIERFVVDYLSPWRTEIGTFIADVVKRWDGKRVAEIIELQVGRDLQYVRINGTVIGALVGAVLFLVSLLVSPVRSCSRGIHASHRQGISGEHP